VLAQGKIHVLSLNSQVQRERITITLTVQTADTARLATMLAKVSQINGVLRARRK
jgi:(p)ppGpp synthase/HD superfamily hydrolase